MTDGPYRLSRNPMCPGLVMMGLGMTVIVGRIGTLLPVPFFVLVSGEFVTAEEKSLANALGKSYRDYKHRVRRWI